MRTLVVAALFAIAAGLIYIRFAPSDPADWHVDPLTATLPAGNGWLVRPEGGNAAAPVLPGTPADLLTTLDAIATATPRTTRLAGSPAEGRITYVTRSRLMGFPDYTTVAALPQGDGAVPVIYARQRFGSRDLGVNQARVESWLAALGSPAT